MRPIFVFGSNLAGAHNGGAARYAVETCGAIMGRATGIQGDSYAIPTMTAAFNTMPVEHIAPFVAEFLTFARKHPEMSFLVTAIGCGIAGHKPADIAPMFSGATENVFLSAKLVGAL